MYLPDAGCSEIELFFYCFDCVFKKPVKSHNIGKYLSSPPYKRVAMKAF